MFRTAKAVLIVNFGLMLAIGAPRALYAASIVVNTLADPGSAGVCALRDAITAANTKTAVNGCAAGTGTDTITFNLSGTITLSTILPFISNSTPDSLTIDGTGQTITIDGGNSFRVLFVNAGATLTLNDLTIAHGNNGPSAGGVFNNGGTLTVTDCTFSNNSAFIAAFNAFGGAIWNGGTLSVNNSTFSNNSATGSGAQGSGGAIYNVATATVTNSIFSGNSTNGNLGAFGGGIFNQGTLTITNSTFSGNSANGLNAAFGSAIDSPGSATVTNDTFSGNSVSSLGATSGGAVVNFGAMTVSNSVLAANGGNCNPTARPTDGGFNISDDASCGFTGTGANGHPIGDNVSDANIALDPAGLANNGGPTQTIALLSNSFAIDAVPLAHSCPATDQRGVIRPDNGETACDIGAYEFQDNGFTINTGATDGYHVQHFDVATHASPSASGYGGPGNSGGSGDALVRIVNAGHSDTTQNGTLCAMIYVFDDIEEQQTCCGCPVTPDGLRTLSVINNLTSNFGVNSANLNAGVIKIITSPLNFQYSSGSIPVVPGINKDTSGQNFACDPSFGQGATMGAGTAIHATIPAPGMRAWENHTESMGSTQTAGFVQGMSVDEFATSPLDLSEANNLTSDCARQIANGSGHGVCTCGAGDNASSHAPR